MATQDRFCERRVNVRCCGCRACGPGPGGKPVRAGNMGMYLPENTMSRIPKALGVGVIVGFLVVMNAGCDKGKSRSEETQGGASPREMLTLDLGNGITMKLVQIPAGKFMMGSPESEKDRYSNEGPQHEVTISKPFFMGVFEVTQQQYERIMGRNPSFFKGAQNPVEFVSWEDAVDFCKKVSQKTGKTVHLPTEAEWEYACRAGTKTRFCYGDDASYSKLADYAWYGNNSYGQTHPVGQKRPNDWGLYDMHGNVLEWCADWYGADYYASAKNADPQGPPSGTNRVQRGGGWFNTPGGCSSAGRRWGSPEFLSSDFGFRAAVDMK